MFRLKMVMFILKMNMFRLKNIMFRLQNIMFIYANTKNAGLVAGSRLRRARVVEQ